MTLPRVQPIAPMWRKEPFDDPDWLFDMKYDGDRALYYLEQRRNRLISRNYNIMTRSMRLPARWRPHSTRSTTPFSTARSSPPTRPAGRNSTTCCVARVAPAYAAFDIVWLNGVDLRDLPLHERRQLAAAGRLAEGIADRFRAAFR